MVRLYGQIRFYQVSTTIHPRPTWPYQALVTGPGVVGFLFIKLPKNLARVSVSTGADPSSSWDSSSRRGSGE